MAMPYVWGASAAEVEASYPCDDLALAGATRAVRAVTTSAPPDHVWPWLCQLRRAPYSYDWVDNLGRQSPRELEPGLTDLRVGQRIASIFTVIAFETGCNVTMRTRPGLTERIFGRVVLTYDIRADGPGSRLVCVLRVQSARGLLGGAWEYALLWGDLVMMRKQLLNLAELAEGQPQAPPHRVPGDH